MDARVTDWWLLLSNSNNKGDKHIPSPHSHEYLWQELTGVLGSRAGTFLTKAGNVGVDETFHLHTLRYYMPVIEKQCLFSTGLELGFFYAGVWA